MLHDVRLVGDEVSNWVPQAVQMRRFEDVGFMVQKEVCFILKFGIEMILRFPV
jgi:hypothetical protein